MDIQVIPLEFYGALEELDPKTKRVFLLLAKFIRESVSKEDFRELEKKVERLSEIKALAEAQRRTEEEVRALAGVVEELSLGLKRTRGELWGAIFKLQLCFLKRGLPDASLGFEELRS